MKQDWTKEPWVRIYDIHVKNADGYSILHGGAINGYNEKRALACVNACVGLSNEDLKLVKEVKAMKKLIEQIIFPQFGRSGHYLENLQHDAGEFLNRIEKGE